MTRRLVLVCFACNLLAACGDGPGAGSSPDAATASDGGDALAEGGAGTDAAVGADAAADLDAAPGSDAAADGGADAAGSGDAGPDASGGDAALPPTLPEYCQELFDAACEWWKSCRDVDDCTGGPMAGLARLCDDAEALLAAGAIAFDPELAPGCLALHAPVAAGDECELGPPPVIAGQGFGPTGRENACTGIVQSTARIGDDCYLDDVFFLDGCGEGYCRSLGQCPGTCTAFVTAGNDCDDTLRCEPPLYCGPGGTCVALGGSGDSCAGGAWCAAELYCDAGEECALRVAEGGDCNPEACAAGLSCEPLELGAEPSVCTARRRLGEACSIDAGCDHPLRCVAEVCSDALAPPNGGCRAVENCPTGYTCHNGGSGSYTCVLAKADGEPCSYHQECAAGHVCSSIPADSTFRCYALGQDGEPCDPRGCDDGLFCNAGACDLNSGEGEACDGELGNCQSGLRCMGDLRCHAPGDAAGDPCSGRDSDTCVGDLFCDAASSTCASPVGLDAACNPSFPATCEADLYCHQPAVSPPGPTCKARIPTGSPCAELGQGCVGYCAAGTCAPTTCGRLDA